MKAPVFGAVLLLAASLSAQGQHPDTVFFEDLTFDEIRDAIGSGSKDVIVAVGGLEGGGEGVVTGRPNVTAAGRANTLARRSGGTLVAPVIPYAPGGLLGVPDADGFTALLESTAVSVKGSGFINIFLIGELTASQKALRTVAGRLDEAWKNEGVRVTYLDQGGASGNVRPVRDLRQNSGPSLFLEDLTPEGIRESIAAGKTALIVPTGGTEKNGFHMAVGKHNFHARAGAASIAATLGNALVAPVLQYVPEGRSTPSSPGVLSCGADCFEPVVESIARSAAQLGFKEILLIGDNGGNQAGLMSVADRLNREANTTGAEVFALTDFYEKGHEYQDAWLLAEFGWNATVVGSHAGIKDTSQLLFVKPQSVRTDRIIDSFTHREEAGISGDPTKATAELGRIGLAFKANAAVAQYRTLKARAHPGQNRSTGRRSDR